MSYACRLRVPLHTRSHRSVCLCVSIVQRFDAPGVIGVATWSKDRMSGLRCAGFLRPSDYSGRHGERRARHVGKGAGGKGRHSTHSAGGGHSSDAEPDSPQWDCEVMTKLFEVKGLVLRINAHTSSG